MSGTELVCLALNHTTHQIVSLKMQICHSVQEHFLILLNLVTSLKNTVGTHNSKYLLCLTSLKLLLKVLRGLLHGSFMSKSSLLNFASSNNTNVLSYLRARYWCCHVAPQGLYPFCGTYIVVHALLCIHWRLTAC